MREIGNLNSKMPRGLKLKENPNYKQEYIQEINKDVEFMEKKKENKKQYDKEYREQNKKRIKERKSILMTCECGCEIRREGKASHLRTEKHKMLMDEKR